MLAFSLYLESVAILPQLLLTLRTGFTNGYVLSYIFILASNSELQILYWIYDYYYEDRYYINDLVIAPTGMVQAMVYVAFYCVHFSRGKYIYLFFNNFVFMHLCCLFLTWVQLSVLSMHG